METMKYFLKVNEEKFSKVFENNLNEILLKKNDFFKELNFNQSNTTKYNNVEIEGDVYIGNDVTIDSFTKIVGPVYIGDNVTISTNVHIRPNTIIGDNVSIGHGSEIKNAIVLSNAKVATNVFVGDSIIGNKTRLGSGVIIANRRFDQEEIFLREENQKISTNTNFFGAIIGDNSRIGANCTTCPGVCIGHDTFVTPGIVVMKNIDSNILACDEQRRLCYISKETIDLK